MTEAVKPPISKPIPACNCPHCNVAGYKVSQPGSRPLYRCFQCKRNFGDSVK